jgi:hypothetical protein
MIMIHFTMQTTSMTRNQLGTDLITNRRGAFQKDIRLKIWFENRQMMKSMDEQGHNRSRVASDHAVSVALSNA